VLSIGGAPCGQQAIKDAKDKLNIRRVSVSQKEIYMQGLAVAWACCVQIILSDV
jgi:hypothetical protein